MPKIKFFPFHERDIEEIGLVCYDKFALINSFVPETDTAPPNSTALSSETIVRVCPNLGEGIYPPT